MLVLDEGTNKRLENLRNEDPVICNITWWTERPNDAS
jgi:hypothetical protein